MRILVTGVAGQVGRAIAGYLTSRGHSVAGIDRNAVGIPNLAEYTEATLGNPDAIKQLRRISPCEGLVHAAASLSYDLVNPEVSLTNCLGTQQIIEIAAGWGTRHLVFISSVPVIGQPRYLPITEEHPVQPLTAYHASKVYGEQLFRLFSSANRACSSLRLTSPVGPRTPARRILASFVHCALSNQPIGLLGRGSRKQNYVDVRDVASAVEACLLHKSSGLFNIAGQESLSNYELARICVEELASSSSIGFTGTPDPEDDVAWEVSTAKAADELGYHPAFTIRQSIQSISLEHANSHSG